MQYNHTIASFYSEIILKINNKCLNQKAIHFDFISVYNLIQNTFNTRKLYIYIYIFNWY